MLKENLIKSTIPNGLTLFRCLTALLLPLIVIYGGEIGAIVATPLLILAGMTAVHQFCTIGQHAFITGGSLVRKDVPPFVKGAREPMSYVGINSIGLRRRGFKSEKIREIQNIYRILYQKSFNNTQAARLIEAEMEATNERDEILQFIKNSKRGIMKGYFSN